MLPLLKPADGVHTVSCFLCPGNGQRAAELLLLMGDNAACPDRDGFTHDMVQLFRRWAACHRESKDAYFSR